ncbi:hypothetical protein [Methanosphaera sp. WGK6]|uniref:hypothetical protein n=1 Tax=Methanosphaera sp. WGK6 TaxID=1561964 RepID=UPI00084C3AB0|nr:hypothetical protein [Methanosphaera sp. WGK6]OED29972.1 hypothetical protein NL43_05330 [Methanosphaera sp. WGK6]
MIKCKLCGFEFDETKEELIDCNCGCGGDNVFCPNCGYEVRLPRSSIPKKVKKEEEQGFFGRMASKLRMGN